MPRPLQTLYAFIKEKIRRFFHVLYWRHLFQPWLGWKEYLKAVCANIFYGIPIPEGKSPFFKKNAWSLSCGRRIRFLRNYKLISIRELSEKLGIDEKTLIDIEEGNLKFSVGLHQTHYQIAQLLDVHPDDINLAWPPDGPPIKNWADHLKERDEQEAAAAAKEAAKRKQAQ